jgi:hypothetical protein
MKKPHGFTPHHSSPHSDPQHPSSLHRFSGNFLQP